MEKNDYSKTIHLPKTEFPMKANLPQREPSILDTWNKEKLYERIREKNKSGEKFVLHDGPPYANGDVHLGTALNKFLKDVILKYKTMKGFDSPYVPGWDCHGMPIEHQVVETIKSDGKKYTKIEIRKLCRKYAEKYVDVQRSQFKRMGVLGDWENPYLTYNPEYEARIIEVFFELYKKNYVYKGLRPVHWCVRCETALAEAEVEYSGIKSPSIYVKFELIKGLEKIKGDFGKKKVYVLIWTTTPWTLPANMGVILNPAEKYEFIDVGNEVLVVAEKLKKEVMTKLGITGYKILTSVDGEILNMTKCAHPFFNRESLVMVDSFVSMDTGTGCVHSAPGHGYEDYVVGARYKIPVVAPVDAKGNFDNTVGEFSGINVFDADERIVEKLKTLGLLVFREDVSHSYPHCWRCKEPVIFRATSQWFFNMDTNSLREKILEIVPRIKWIPNWGEEKFFNMIKDRPDWCLSRQRAWGVPIPAVYCRECKEVVLDENLVKGLIEVVRKEGVDCWFEKEPSEFYPDIKCPKCGEDNFSKETDILDVWFDSAVSFTAVVEKNPNLRFPSDIYLEGSDQHRGWFQVSMLVSMAIKEMSPYEAVITHGLILDKEGKKMSKSLGNVISPIEIIGKYGSDIFRLWLSSINYTNDNSTGEDVFTPVAEVYRKIRNTCKFILGNLNGFNCNKDKVRYEDMMELDRWILHRLNLLVERTEESFEEYKFYTLFHDLQNFCAIDLSALYFDIVKDRLYTWKKDGMERKSCQTALYEILSVVARLMAPVLSFTAEEAWSHLKAFGGNEESVHLSEWTRTDDKFINYPLKKKWEVVFSVREKVAKAIEEKRAKKEIGNSLEVEVVLLPKNAELTNILREFNSNANRVFAYSIKDIFIVSSCKVAESAPDTAGNADYEDAELKVLINILKDKWRKCPRCWNYYPETGEDICGKCRSAIE